MTRGLAKEAEGEGRTIKIERNRTQPFRFVGVQHIKSLDDDQPGDGSEIGGRFYDAFDIWQRVESLIPKKEEIPVIMWEGHPNTPVGELMSPKQKKDLRVIFPK